MLPSAHRARLELAHEVHARPYEAHETPQRASFIALLAPPGIRHLRRTIVRSQDS